MGDTDRSPPPSSSDPPTDPRGIHASPMGLPPDLLVQLVEAMHRNTDATADLSRAVHLLRTDLDLYSREVKRHGGALAQLPCVAGECAKAAE